MTERDYYLGFSLFPGIGPKRFRELLRHFTSAESAWQAEETALATILGKALSEKFFTFRRLFNSDEYLTRLEKQSVWFVTLQDSEYPKLLAELADPPIVLFGKGSRDSIHRDKCTFIGVVGTRKITSYGKQVTDMITGELVAAGCIIVSGLALGVDAAAHDTTIAHNGVTIAVLGCGVDLCHPSSNQPIYNSIITSGGAVVSEYPLGEPPSRGSFPSRNRIIAGLSHGVVVTEGAVDSGALYTAEDAFANNRQVFAVPGPITSSLSRGPNSLLLKGAKLVTSGRDILENLGVKADTRDKVAKVIVGETEEEQKIIDLLENEALLFDEIVKRSGFDSSKAGILLSVMELKGMIRIAGAGIYELHFSS